MKISTAIVGYGFSAKTFHIPFITTSDRFTFDALSSSQAQAIEHDWPNVTYFNSADAMIEQSNADLVIITAPNDVHFSLAKRALENNKHVLLEKPFVTRSTDGEVLMALAKEKGLLLSVYQNRRYDGDFLTVKQLLAQKKLGQLRVFESRFDRFRPQVKQRWRETVQDGGGILFDLGSHLLDQALTLFGLPESIAARCLAMREASQVTDFFTLTLHYPEFEVVLRASPFSAGPIIRFQLQGDKGSFIKYGLDPQENCLKAGRLPVTHDWGQEDEQYFGRFYDEQHSEIIPTDKGCYQRFFADLADAIDSGKHDLMDAKQSLNTIKLIELAMESQRTGKMIMLDFE